MPDVPVVDENRLASLVHKDILPVQVPVLEAIGGTDSERIERDYRALKGARVPCVSVGDDVTPNVEYRSLALRCGGIDRLEAGHAASAPRSQHLMAHAPCN